VEASLGGQSIEGCLSCCLSRRDLVAKEAADAERRKEERRRKERKNRDSFTALVRQALADGRISAKTRFKVHLCFVNLLRNYGDALTAPVHQVPADGRISVETRFKVRSRTKALYKVAQSCKVRLRAIKGLSRARKRRE